MFKRFSSLLAAISVCLGLSLTSPAQVNVARSPNNVISQLGASGVTDINDDTNPPPTDILYGNYLVKTHTNGLIHPSLVDFGAVSVIDSTNFSFVHPVLGGVPPDFGGSLSRPYDSITTAVSNGLGPTTVVLLPGTHTAPIIDANLAGKGTINLVGFDPDTTFVDNTLSLQTGEDMTVRVSGITFAGAIDQVSSAHLNVELYNRASVGSIAWLDTIPASLTLTRDPSVTIVAFPVGTEFTDVMSHDSTNIRYNAADLGNWFSDDPTNVHTALDRLAANAAIASLPTYATQGEVTVFSAGTWTTAVAGSDGEFLAAGAIPSFKILGDIATAPDLPFTAPDTNTWRTFTVDVPTNTEEALTELAENFALAPVIPGTNHGDILAWDGSNYVPVVVGTNASAYGQILYWDATNWVALAPLDTNDILFGLGLDGKPLFQDPWSFFKASDIPYDAGNSNAWYLGLPPNDLAGAVDTLITQAQSVVSVAPGTNDGQVLYWDNTASNWVTATAGDAFQILYGGPIPEFKDPDDIVLRNGPEFGTVVALDFTNEVLFGGAFTSAPVIHMSLEGVAGELLQHEIVERTLAGFKYTVRDGAGLTTGITSTWIAVNEEVGGLGNSFTNIPANWANFPAVVDINADGNALTNLANPVNDQDAVTLNTLTSLLTTAAGTPTNWSLFSAISNIDFDQNIATNVAALSNNDGSMNISSAGGDLELESVNDTVSIESFTESVVITAGDEIRTDANTLDMHSDVASILATNVASITASNVILTAVTNNAGDQGEVTVRGHAVPAESNEFTLGTTPFPWADMYVGNEGSLTSQLATIAAGQDNLGDHQATIDLDMAGNQITNVLLIGNNLNGSGDLLTIQQENVTLSSTNLKITTGASGGGILIEARDTVAGVAMPAGVDASVVMRDVSGGKSLFLNFAVGGVDVIGNVKPVFSNVTTLGTELLPWKDLYLGPGSLHIEDIDISKVAEQLSLNTNVTLRGHNLSDVEDLYLANMIFDGASNIVMDAGGHMLFSQTNGNMLDFDDGNELVVRAGSLSIGGALGIDSTITNFNNLTGDDLGSHKATQDLDMGGLFVTNLHRLKGFPSITMESGIGGSLALFNEDLQGNGAIILDAALNLSLQADNASGTVTIVGSEVIIVGDIIPQQSNAFDFGRSTRPWRNGYIDNIFSTGSLQIGSGTFALDGSGALASNWNSRTTNGFVIEGEFVGDGSALTNLASIPQDNLGDHQATQDLDMNGFAITNAIIAGDNLGSHLASQDLDMGTHDISGNGGGGSNPFDIFTPDKTVGSPAIDVPDIRIKGGDSISVNAGPVDAGNIIIQPGRVFGTNTVPIPGDIELRLGKTEANSSVGHFRIEDAFGYNIMDVYNPSAGLFGPSNGIVSINGNLEITSDGGVTFFQMSSTGGLQIGEGTFKLATNGNLAANWDGGGYTISNVVLKGDGAGLTNLPIVGDNLGDHQATEALDMNGWALTNAISIGVEDGAGFMGMEANGNVLEITGAGISQIYLDGDTHVQGELTVSADLTVSGNNITNTAGQLNIDSAGDLKLTAADGTEAFLEAGGTALSLSDGGDADLVSTRDIDLVASDDVNISASPTSTVRLASSVISMIATNPTLNLGSSIQVKNDDVTINGQIGTGTPGTYDIGTPTERFKNLYLSESLYTGSNSVHIGSLELSDLGDGVLSLGNTNVGAVAGLAMDRVIYGDNTTQTTAFAGSDNLGNHTATEHLDMAGFDVTNAGTLYVTDIHITNEVINSTSIIVQAFTLGTNDAIETWDAIATQVGDAGGFVTSTNPGGYAEVADVDALSNGVVDVVNSAGTVVTNIPPTSGDNLGNHTITQDLLPDASNAWNIGSATLPMLSIYVSPTSSVHLGDASIGGTGVYIKVSGVSFPDDTVWESSTITSNNIGDNQVGESEIQVDSVGASEIQTDAVGALEISANAVSSGEIQDGTVAIIDLSSAVTSTFVQTDFALGLDALGTPSSVSNIGMHGVSYPEPSIANSGKFVRVTKTGYEITTGNAGDMTIAEFASGATGAVFGTVNTAEYATISALSSNSESIQTYTFDTIVPTNHANFLVRVRADGTGFEYTSPTGGVVGDMLVADYDTSTNINYADNAVDALHAFQSDFAYTARTALAIGESVVPVPSVYTLSESGYVFVLEVDIAGAGSTNMILRDPGTISGDFMTQNQYDDDQDFQVNTAELALVANNALAVSDNTITSAKIVNGSILDADVATNAFIESSKIKDGALTTTSRYSTSSDFDPTDPILDATVTGLDGVDIPAVRGHFERLGWDTNLAAWIMIPAGVIDTNEGIGGGVISALTLVTNTLQITEAGIDWNIDLAQYNTGTNPGGYAESGDNVSSFANDSLFAQTNANWNTAFGWGDHSVAGYLTSVNTNPGGYAELAADLTQFTALGGVTDQVFVSHGTGAGTWQTLAVPAGDGTGPLTATLGAHTTGSTNGLVRTNAVDNGVFVLNSQHSTVLGGSSNVIDDSSFATIVGGVSNRILGDSIYAVISGGNGNLIEGVGTQSTIGGGLSNKIDSIRGTIAGGNHNYASGASDNTIGGGRFNQIGANTTRGAYNTIAGGDGNEIRSGTAAADANDYSFIGGGLGNDIEEKADYAAIVTGQGNLIDKSASWSFIGSGTGNDIETNAIRSAIVVGSGNRINQNANDGFIGSGSQNDIALGAIFSSIVGGHNNQIDANLSGGFVGGGAFNTSDGEYSVVVGGYNNDLNAAGNDFGFLGGGASNGVSGGTHNIIVGGSRNVMGNVLGHNFIGGGEQNRHETGNDSHNVIVGGYYNTMDDTDQGFIGGGRTNKIILTSDGAAIVSGLRNIIDSSTQAFIGSGEDNEINGGDESVITGGKLNLVTADQSTIGGGENNSVLGNGLSSVIAGGEDNTINSGAPHSTIAGGEGNTINNDHSFIGGGQGNLNNGNFQVISGGNSHSNYSGGGNIAGGSFNRLDGSGAQPTIGGGAQNRIEGNTGQGVIAGGSFNILRGGNTGSVIGGGGSNEIGTNSPLAVIGGGNNNDIRLESDWATIAGGNSHIIHDFSPGAFIGGGQQNAIQKGSPFATIGGGLLNGTQQTNAYATIAGGRANSISRIGAQGHTISGGEDNDIDAENGSVISGGNTNIIRSGADYSVISGGKQNDIDVGSAYAVIGGGFDNLIDNESDGSVIPGGVSNTISLAAKYAWAGGINATASNDNSFVWNGGSHGVDTFNANSAGGLWVTDNAGGNGEVHMNPSEPRAGNFTMSGDTGVTYGVKGSGGDTNFYTLTFTINNSNLVTIISNQLD